MISNRLEKEMTGRASGPEKKSLERERFFFRIVLGTEINLYICSPFEKRKILDR